MAQQKMKIVHISTRDKIGGASIAAFRLHSAMLENRIDSHMLVLEVSNPVDSNIYGLNKWKRRVWNHFSYKRDNSKLRNYRLSYVFSTGMVGFNLANHPLVKSADVIYIHWINSMLSIHNIKQLLALNKPVFWFMHDMWAWTGGCHHCFDCRRYITHCGNCICLGSTEEKDLSYKIHHLKLKYFAQYPNLHAVVPSKWMEQYCRESALFKHREIYFIPNVIDTSVFKPIDKTAARKLLNLPLNKKLILFGADIGVNNIYKGWEYLEKALEKLHSNEFEVAVFGNSDNSSLVEHLPYRVHFMGYLHDSFTLAMLYNAVDVYVSPSLVESFGQTIAEAMACSVPLTAFNVGGIPELVKHKETGYLAKYKDVTDLANGIQWCLTNWYVKENGEASRSYIENYCSYQQGIRAHKDMLNRYVNVLE